MKIGALEKKWLKAHILPTGVDEVGRGSLAGPVFAAAVTLDYPKLWKLPKDQRALIRDSKKLAPHQRQEAYQLVHQVLLDFGIGFSENKEIETLGLSVALNRAILRAINQLQKKPSFIAMDGNKKIDHFPGDQQPIIKGDNLCYCIASASILAKVSRDSLMDQYSKMYPVFGFSDHKGYGTKQHLLALQQHGPCQLHRTQFKPIKNLFSQNSLFDEISAP